MLIFMKPSRILCFQYPKFMSAIMKEDTGFVEKEQLRLAASKNDPTLSRDKLLSIYAQSQILASFTQNTTTQSVRVDPYANINGQPNAGQQHADQWYHNVPQDNGMNRPFANYYAAAVAALCCRRQ